MEAQTVTVAASGSKSRLAFPWPPAEDESVVQAAVRTWLDSALRPAAFFRALPEEHGIGAALMYYLPLGILVAGIGLFWSQLLGPADASQIALLQRLGLAGAPIDPVVDFLLSPAYLLVTLFLFAGLSHFALIVLGARRRTFRATAQVYAYAYSPALLSAVPYLGTLAGGIWALVIAIIGLREVHRTSGWRAGAAVLAPVLLLVAVVFVLLLAALTGALLIGGGLSR